MNLTPLHHEKKKEFQLERMILFSDAVFAIAITLLVIDMKIPEFPMQEVTDQKLLEALGHLAPRFIGFLFSYGIIGLYWVIHHRIFGFVINYTRTTLVLNLAFLMFIVLMPFTTGFYNEYVTALLETPVMLYVGNIILLGLFNFFLWRHLTNPKLGLVVGVTREDRNYSSYRSLVGPGVFALMAVVYLFAPSVALMMPVLIPVVIRAGRRFFIPKLKVKTS